MVDSQVFYQWCREDLIAECEKLTDRIGCQNRELSSLRSRLAIQTEALRKLSRERWGIGWHNWPGHKIIAAALAQSETPAASKSKLSEETESESNDAAIERQEGNLLRWSEERLEEIATDIVDSCSRAKTNAEACEITKNRLTELLREASSLPEQKAPTLYEGDSLP